MLLRVPSVTVPAGARQQVQHANFLLDSRHPEYAARVEVGPVQNLVWDVRMSGLLGEDGA